jgi:hypothetical protein
MGRGRTPSINELLTGRAVRPRTGPNRGSSSSVAPGSLEEVFRGREDLLIAAPGDLRDIRDLSRAIVAQAALRGGERRLVFCRADDGPRWRMLLPSRDDVLCAPRRDFAAGPGPSFAGVGLVIVDTPQRMAVAERLRSQPRPRKIAISRHRLNEDEFAADLAIYREARVIDLTDAALR